MNSLPAKRPGPTRSAMGFDCFIFDFDGTLACSDDAYSAALSAYDGIPDALRGLKNEHALIGIVSLEPRDEVAAPKPHPDGVNKIMTRLPPDPASRLSSVPTYLPDGRFDEKRSVEMALDEFNRTGSGKSAAEPKASDVAVV